MKAIFFMIIISCSLYTSAQTFDWAIQMGGSGSTSHSRAVAIDAAGNVYITGYFEKTVDFNPGAGTASLTSTGGNDAFLAKYDANGNYVWAKNIMGGVDGRQGASGVAVSADGKVIVVGDVSSGANYYNTNIGIDSFVTTSGGFFMAQYDTAGNYAWARYMGDISAPNAITTDLAGNIYITGIFSQTVDFDPGSGVALVTHVSNGIGNQSNTYIAKYDRNGNYKWAGGIGGTAYAQGFDIAVDTAGGKNDVYVTGFFVDTMDFDLGTGVANLMSTGGQDIFIAKYDSSGDYIWAKGMGGARNEFGNSIAVGKSGNVYITGPTLSLMVDFDPGPDTAIIRTTGIQEMFLAKYEANGDYVWAFNAAGSMLLSLSNGMALEIDTLESIYVGGYLAMGTVDFDPGPGVAAITPVGAEKFFAKYDACGNYIHAGATKGRDGSSSIWFSNPSASGIALDTKGSIYCTGGFSGSIDFDPGDDSTMLTAVGTHDVFLSKNTFTDIPANVRRITAAVCQNYELNGMVYTSSGTYLQVVPGTGRCDSTIILYLTINQITKPVVTVNGFELGVILTYSSYQWMKDGVLIPDATEGTYTVSENANYQVIVTNEFGCMDTSDVYRVTNVAINTVVALAAQINVYPNPVKDVVYIQAPVPVNAILMDMQGRTITEVKDVRSISLRNLSSGIYQLLITDKNGISIKTEKLIKR